MKNIDDNRMYQVAKFLFLTTKKETIDEEEFIKESEKKDLTEEEAKKALKYLVNEKILKETEPHAYCKGENFRT